MMLRRLPAAQWRITRSWRRWTMAEAISKLPPRRNSPVPTSDAEPFNLSELTADIVAALVANNALPIADLPALIQSVHGALAQLASGPVMMGLPAYFIDEYPMRPQI